jgi:hypothetical protein
MEYLVLTNYLLAEDGGIGLRYETTRSGKMGKLKSGDSSSNHLDMHIR